MPASTRSAQLPVWCYAVVLAVVVLAAYGADVGRGFVKEDATWVMQSRIASLEDLTRVFTDSGGFFRPVVALSFALNYRLFGGEPLGYGYTNLLLAIGGAIALYQLARILGLPAGSALLASGLWILNFHGINMAVLWLSGRTALLLVLFALLAAIATARGRIGLASLFAWLAMASKEEGVLLPVILGAVLWLRPHGPPERRQMIVFGAAMLAIWGTYAALRLQSDAMLPTNAPAFYTLGGPGWSLRRNLVEYVDRALTFPLALTILAVAIGGRRPYLLREDGERIGVGTAWLAVGFALTMLLPTRSSLYAVFPSVGGALACAAVIHAAWRGMTDARRRFTAAAALILPFLFLPIYWQRNVRWTELAALSSEVVAAFRQLAITAPADWTVIVVDDRSSRSNVASAIALPDAIELSIGRRPHVWLVPPPGDMEPDDWSMAPATADAIVALREGRIVAVPRQQWSPAPAADLR